MQRVYLDKINLETKNSFDADLTPSPNIQQNKNENGKKHL